MEANQLICTFSVAEKHYGVVVDHVQEVLANHQITDILLGLMNIRGRIVPAIALRKVLRLPGENEDDNTINIIINHGGEQVGLMVDRIGDIVSVLPEEIEPPPETLKGAPRKFMRGVFPVQGTLYLLLDLDTLLADELCSRSASRAAHSLLQ